MPIGEIYKLPLVGRKSQLRRTWSSRKSPITPSQRVWVRYLLTLWGRHMGGDDSPGGCVNVIGRLMVRSEWGDGRAKAIIDVVNRLHDQGLRGEDLFRRSRDVVMPWSSTDGMISAAKEADDAEFVESVMSKAIHRKSPIREIAIKRYCEHKSTQDVARIISNATGCDIQVARKRVAWCEEILEDDMYHAMKNEMNYSDDK